MYRFVAIASICLIAAQLAACAQDDERDIIARSPSAISITSTRFTEPTDIAQKHCAKYGKKAVSRGGVKLGSPAYKIMWGFDCVDPG